MGPPHGSTGTQNPTHRPLVLRLTLARLGKPSSLLTLPSSSLDPLPRNDRAGHSNPYTCAQAPPSPRMPSFPCDLV